MKYNNDLSRSCNADGGLRIVYKKELAQRLGVNESTIYRMIKDKRLPAPMTTVTGRNAGWTHETITKWFKKYSM